MFSFTMDAVLVSMVHTHVIDRVCHRKIHRERSGFVYAAISRG